MKLMPEFERTQTSEAVERYLATQEDRLTEYYVERGIKPSSTDAEKVRREAIIKQYR